jgi:predicted MFS family arabinose efflux permease
MGAQALSGVAKDLTKMSAKSSIRVLVPEGKESALFKWVALLTGSKNALKGTGFFLGGFLLSLFGYAGSLLGMAGALALILLVTTLSLPVELGRAKARPKFKGIFSKSPEVNILSAARFFLFGARDIWFVVGVPVFLAADLGFSFTSVGALLAAWVIGYGIIQALAPAPIGWLTGGHAPEGRSAWLLAFALAGLTALIAGGLLAGYPPAAIVVAGLGAFGVVFAINSAVHSYLILAYSDGDKVAMNVGFYYMANAGGRLVGTVLSGVTFQAAGLLGCLWVSVAFAAAAGALSLLLPRKEGTLQIADLHVDGSE